MASLSDILQGGQSLFDRLKNGSAVQDAQRDIASQAVFGQPTQSPGISELMSLAPHAPVGELNPAPQQSYASNSSEPSFLKDAAGPVGFLASFVGGPKTPSAVANAMDRRLVPAVSVDGKVYLPANTTGATHGDAFLNWTESAGIPWERAEAIIKRGGLVDGYVTPEGKFLNRQEANDWARRPRDPYGLESTTGRYLGIVKSLTVPIAGGATLAGVLQNQDQQ